MIFTIILITFISIVILIIGFLEIQIPFLSFSSSQLINFNQSGKKITKHTKKLLRKRLWNNEMHKGFIDLST